MIKKKLKSPTVKSISVKVKDPYIISGLDLEILVNDSYQISIEELDFFESQDAEIGCAIQQVYNIPKDNDFAYLKHLKTKALKLEAISTFFSVILNDIKKGNAFLILSNNLKADNVLVNEALSKICASSEIRTSPSSKNQIIIYVF